MKTINDIKIREPKTANEKMVFSYLMQEIENAEYGSIEVKLTIRDGKVVNIKNKIEKNFCVNS